MSQDDDNDHDHNIKEDLHEHDMVMPGFRFHPTEEELIEFYLRRKIEGKRFNVDLITFLDLYRYDPWELPALAAIGEKEWYFYVPRDRKYRNGDRPNRVTTSGYWKATGADRLIQNENLKPIGLKKTLVFYSGKAPRGVRTSWIMNEYRLPHHETEMLQKAEISLCRVYKRPGVEDHRPATVSRSHLGKAASSSSSKAVAHNLDTKLTSQQQDVVMNSSRGQTDEAEKMMSAETSASSSTDVVSGIISQAKHDNNSSYDVINPFLQIPSLPPTHTSSFFSIFGGCSNLNNINPVLPHHQNQNNIQFEDLQMMPGSYQQGYLNQQQQQQQQPLLGLNMAPNSSFWDQWTSSSNSVLGGDKGSSSSKAYINATNPFQ